MNTLNVRPAFYRPRGSETIISGWQATTTGDIYTLDETGQGYALVAGAKVALGKGTRVEFTKALDLFPTDFIEERERGIVSHVDEETGTVSVLLEGVHVGLGDNTLALTPHNDDEAIAALECLKPSSMRDRARQSESVLGVLCGLATLLVTAPATALLGHFFPHHPSGMFLMCGVIWTAVVLGQRAALALAAVSPFVFNLVAMPPTMTFALWTPWEYVAAASYLSMAVVFSWAASHGRRTVQRALELCFQR